eukprot:snap_masked-scaffold_19-processed-gene-3.21-mRNA-1 protein AED:1.00 eAED:1.00 QI:0/0/0/0/1/1/2/0/263
MYFWIKYPSRETLRDEIIEKWQEYAMENNLNCTLHDIVAIEVGGKEKLYQVKTEQFYFNCMQFSEIFQPSNFLEVYDLKKISTEYLRSLVLISITLALVFCYALFTLILVFNEEWIKYILRRSILISTDGIFLYYRKFEALTLPDDKYSPLAILLRYFIGTTSSPLLREMAEIQMFIKFSELQYVKKIEETVPKFQEYALGFGGAVDERISENLALIISEAKNNYETFLARAAVVPTQVRVRKKGFLRRAIERMRQIMEFVKK